MTSDIEAEAKQNAPSVPVYGTLQIHSISSLYMCTAALYWSFTYFIWFYSGLVVRVLDYRSRGPAFDSRALQKKVVGLEQGPLSLVSTTDELLDLKVAAPV
jgi:hypothetical protein